MLLTSLTPFGIKCRELRLNAERRVIEHADALSIEPAAITDYETGRKVPSEEYVLRTAYWLRVPTTELEKLLSRIPAENRIIQFTPQERESLQASRRLLGKAPSLSALILKLDEYRARDK